jgi:hypothetical protein
MYRTSKESRPRSAHLVGAITAAFMLLHILVAPAAATLIAISPPPSVLPGALESTTDAFLFPEKTVTLGAPLSVDISVPGTYNNSNPNSVGNIAAGTKVKSFFMHHDSLNGQFYTATGFAIAPANILGIIYTDAKLNATDALLGNPTTAYPTGVANRGLEIPFVITPDSIFWSGNMIFISFVSNTAAVLDQMRILVAIPEPSTLVLGLSAAASLLLFSRARRRTV